jgi:glycosyltransferase involved in cell wall biosynthesis
MAGADLLVLPSSLEGYGMAMTEALFAGLPVLASREAARAAGIGDGGPALVFDDAAGLQGALRRFVEDPQLRAALGTAARQATLPRWRASASEFRQVLTRAARGRSGGRAGPP